MLTTQQFERTRGLALRLGSIALFDRHRELLHRRSRVGVRNSEEWSQTRTFDICEIATLCRANSPQSGRSVARLKNRRVLNCFVIPRLRLTQFNNVECQRLTLLPSHTKGQVIWRDGVAGGELFWDGATGYRVAQPHA